MKAACIEKGLEEPGGEGEGTGRRKVDVAVEGAHLGLGLG